MAQRIAVILAAGKGTRINSELPKVLVPVCGRPMIDYVVESLRRADVERQIIVVGHRSDLVREHLAGQNDLCFVEQTEQLGTGHAVMVCRDELADHDGAVLIVAGDSPLIQDDSVGELFGEFDRRRPACIMGTGYRNDPTGFGRVIRGADGNFESIVEEKDATDEQRRITEINLSCYVFNCRDLLDSLGQIDNSNSQGEYYITDCPGILLRNGKDVIALDVLKPCESLSINTVDDLGAVEEAMRQLRLPPLEGEGLRER
jgi:bifunctional UDP-N-acetylglucosamine pyrophosphorylase/glucosamine-1-phosphate N-acetyltransferase/UDP-N-acetylglucosamine pyrophosphorylase